MQASFYTAGTGTKAFQSKLDVIGNNLANVNTAGYKSKTPVFSELMYVDYGDAQAGHLQGGKGAKLTRGNTVHHANGGVQDTGGNLDFALTGEGYFAVSDLEGEDILYTRDGRFMITYFGDTPYLTNSSGKAVLNAEGEPIDMTDMGTNAQLSDMNIGVFRIPVRDGMQEDGFNNYRITEKNGEPEAIESPDIVRGNLETSNVDVGKEFSQVIETQRAYSLTLKMLQTSDEIEQDINSLRR